MTFDFKGKDTCANPKEIDLLVKALSEEELLPMALRWFKDKGGARLAAALEQMDYVRAANIGTKEDKMRFDATFDCRLKGGEVQRLTFRGMMVYEEPALWFNYDTTYEGDAKPYPMDMRRADMDIVPIIAKNSLDAEAAAFLRAFCPEALKTPQALPIERILEDKLDLLVLYETRGLPEEAADEQVFGRIFFTDTPTEYVCPVTGAAVKSKISNGTIFAEGTGRIGNEGCINNTLAHEGFHWYRHRMYAAVRNKIHHDKPFIACRKTAREVAADKPWTDEDRIEWQANAIAPRILMPREPFKAKAREFMLERGYTEGTKDGAAPEAVIRDLADFFKVSRRSAGIRLVEVGLIREDSLPSRTNAALPNHTTTISPAEAFREYRENAKFRELLDTGAVQYVENHFVLNDKRYIADVGGRRFLTTYAREHQRECCLAFALCKVYPKGTGLADGVAYRRGGKLKTEHRFEPEDGGALSLAELKELDEKFKMETGSLAEIMPTFAQLATRLMKAKRWNAAIFTEKTHLDKTAYSRIMNDKAKNITARTVAAVCVGIGANKELADRLFEAAGHSMYNEDERFAYNFLVTSMTGRSVDECNAFLESQGLEPLGNRQREPLGVQA